jgi:hypothetical protein
MDEGGAPQRLRVYLLLMASWMTISFLLLLFTVNATSLGEFLVLLFAAQIFLFLPTASITMSILTSVPPAQRPAAVAFQTTMLHALGDVPSPIVLGKLMDTWAPLCGQVGYETLTTKHYETTKRYKILRNTTKHYETLQTTSRTV